jgi:hypothetical protein
MSSRFEALVVFGIISVLVSLFAWIYLRDRQKRTGLWMLGWIAILVHFAAPAFSVDFPHLAPFTLWIKVCTLIIAGTFFLLSVSEVFAQQRRRIAFILFVSAAAVLYLTILLLHVRTPWFYLSLLFISIGYGIVQAIRYYGWRSPYLYLLLLLAPYGGWAAQQAMRGALRHGINFYLLGFFYVTGLVYFRHFRRFSPGVILTSVAFMAWGCVFPLSTILAALGMGPGPGSVFWDLP